MMASAGHLASFPVLSDLAAEMGVKIIDGGVIRGSYECVRHCESARFVYGWRASGISQAVRVSMPPTQAPTFGAFLFCAHERGSLDRLVRHNTEMSEGATRGH